jgi:hypothetical protein
LFDGEWNLFLSSSDFVSRRGGLDDEIGETKKHSGKRTGIRANKK